MFLLEFILTALLRAALVAAAAYVGTLLAMALYHLLSAKPKKVHCMNSIMVLLATALGVRANAMARAALSTWFVLSGLFLFIWCIPLWFCVAPMAAFAVATFFTHLDWGS